jgi:hypothetical protein
MSWNIFKRVAELERWVRDLTDFNGDHSRWIARLEEKAQKLENANQVLVNSNQALIGRHENIGKRLANLEHQVYMQSRQLNPYSAAPVHSEGEPVFTKDEVDLEVSQEKEKKRQYQREWYAQNKIKKAAQEKKNAYARAYYARKKGKANA